MLAPSVLHPFSDFHPNVRGWNTWTEIIQVSVAGGWHPGLSIHIIVIQAIPASHGSAMCHYYLLWKCWPRFRLLSASFLSDFLTLFPDQCAAYVVYCNMQQYHPVMNTSHQTCKQCLSMCLWEALTNVKQRCLSLLSLMNMWPRPQWLFVSFYGGEG